MMLRPLLVGCCALLLTTCQRETSNIFLELSGRIFVFNYRVATANYLVTLRKVAPVPAGSIVEAEFENPRGGDALVTSQQASLGGDKVSLASPFLDCVKKDRPYRVHVRLTGPDGDVLQELDTTITSDVDQTVLPTRPLVIGPGYTPNPDVFKPDGSDNYGIASDCPP
jgi:hypothetical protein